MPSILKDSVELRHLRYLQAVGDAGSFTRAAAEIGLAQPTLSHQIAQLESALGVQLVSRSRQACHLTPAGELVLQYSRRVLGDVRAMRRALDDLSEMRRGSLSIAILPSLAQTLLPLALARFHQAHPNVQVTVREMTIDDMARSLATDKIDIGIGCLGTPLKLKGNLLFSEELVAVCAKDDPLAKQSAVTFADLATRDLLVFPPGYGTRALIANAALKAQRRLRFAMEASSADVLIAALSARNGVAIVPPCALWGRKPDRWVSRPVSRANLKREVGLLLPLGASMRPTSAALFSILKDAVRQIEKI